MALCDLARSRVLVAADVATVLKLVDCNARCRAGYRPSWLRCIPAESLRMPRMDSDSVARPALIWAPGILLGGPLASGSGL